MITMQRGEKITTVQTNLITETCPACGCWHAIPEGLYNKAKEDSSLDICCPNGHKYHFTRTLQEQLNIAQRKAQVAEGRVEFWKDQCTGAERSRSAHKAVATRLKKRLKKGLCPCCNKHFPDLHKHIKIKHPNWDNNSKD